MLNAPGRRRYTVALLLGSLVAACGGGGGSSTATATATPTPAAKAKPNIVFILTDDLDSESVRVMTKMKSLIADHGITFTNTFASDPLCCPSRASMLRGQYAHNHGILDNGRGTNTCFDVFKRNGMETSTVATWLKSAGYTTGLVGKYLNQYPGSSVGGDYIPPGWDYWFADYSSEGSDAYYAYSANDNGKIVSYGSTTSDYLTDVLNGKALDFVNKATASKQPFFLWLATSAPHAPALAAQQYMGTYIFEKAPRIPSFNEDNMNDKPRYFRTLPLMNSSAIEDCDGLYRARLDTLVSVDAGIEKLVQAVQAAGQMDNTYFFFSSDNGFLSGQHRFPNGKDAAYEESIRIPLVVSGPGVPAGKTLTHDLMNIDYGPTFAELAGATPPGFVDGRSFASLLTGSPTSLDNWRKEVLLEHWTQDVGGIPDYVAARSDQWILVLYGSTNEFEFYDLVNDPFQLDSRATGVNPTASAQLAARIAVLQSCVGASCR